MFNFMKRKKKEKVVVSNPLPLTADNVQAVQHHKTRISNLQDELGQLSGKIEQIELSESSRNAKNKETSLLINRMSVIKYEIETRGELLRWLY